MRRQRFVPAQPISSRMSMHVIVQMNVIFNTTVVSMYLTPCIDLLCEFALQMVTSLPTGPLCKAHVPPTLAMTSLQASPGLW